MNRPTPLMYSIPPIPARAEDQWAAAHAKLVGILLAENSTPPQRYAAARAFCYQMALESTEDYFDWQKEADHWQTQLERVQGLSWGPSVPVSDNDEPPF